MKISAGFLFRLILSLSAVVLMSGIHAGTAFGNDPVRGHGLKKLKWRALGPSLFGGRIADIAVAQDSNQTIYCAAAQYRVYLSSGETAISVIRPLICPGPINRHVKGLSEPVRCFSCDRFGVSCMYHTECNNDRQQHGPFFHCFSPLMLT